MHARGRQRADEEQGDCRQNQQWFAQTERLAADRNDHDGDECAVGHDEHRSQVPAQRGRQ